MKPDISQNLKWTWLQMAQGRLEIWRFTHEVTSTQEIFAQPSVGNCGLCGLPSIPPPYPWRRSQCIMRLEGRDLFIDYISWGYKYSTRVPENLWLLNHATNHYHTCQFSESNKYIYIYDKSILLPGVTTPTLKSNTLCMYTYPFINWSM
jgi:hypothetical protein